MEGQMSQLDPSDPKAIIGILVEIFNQPNTIEEQEVMAINASKWRSPIIEYLKSSTVGTNL